MAIYPAPALVLAPALAIDLALVVRGALARRGAARDRLLPAMALGLLLVLVAGAFPLFGEWGRQWPVALGLLLGGGLGLLWGWALPEPVDPAHAEPVGPLASGLLAVGLLAWAQAEGAGFANAGLGLMLGWGAVALLARLFAPAGPGFAPSAALGLAGTALAAGAAAWGEKLAPGAGLGAPLALGLGSAAALALALARLIGGPAGRWTGTLAAAAVWVLAALTLGAAYAQKASMLGALLLGGLLGLLAPRFAAPPAPAPTAEPAEAAAAEAGEAGLGPVASVALLVLAGGALVLDNRLGGVFAIGLGGLGLALAFRPGARAAAVQPLAALLVALFAGRVWLQLFLDRTLLTGYGIDLTHPYAFAGLILGGLLPFAAAAIGRLCRPDRLSVTLWAIALAVLPAWVGYFVHVEALGALLSGLTLAAFALGLPEGPLPEARGLAVPLLIATIASTMLSAPWLVGAMNATRQARVHALLLGCLALALAWAWWYWRVGRRALAAA
jgi:hypothetical protein